MTFPIYNFSPSGDAWLLTGIVAGDTSLTVFSGAGANFSTSNFVIYIQAECIVVGSRSGDTFSSLTRAANGTTAVTHAAGERVSERISPLHFSVFNDNIPKLSTTTPANVSGSGLAGTSASSVRSDHTHQGVVTISASGNAPSYGGIVFLPGTNASISQSGGSITFYGGSAGGANNSTDTPAGVGASPKAGGASVSAPSNHIHKGILSVLAGTGASVETSTAGCVTIGMTGSGWTSAIQLSNRFTGVTYANGGLTRFISAVYGASTTIVAQADLQFKTGAASPPTNIIDEFQMSGVADSEKIGLGGLVLPNEYYTVIDNSQVGATINLSNWIEYDDSGGAGGTVTGSGAASQITYFSAPSVITSGSSLTWDTKTLTIAPVAVTGGATVLQITGVANVAQVAEVIDVNFNLARTVTFTHGFVPSTQRAVYFQAPTYANSTGSDSITLATTVSISGAPIASGLTITNGYALRVDGGTSQFVGPVMVGGGVTPVVDGSLQISQTAYSGGSSASPALYVAVGNHTSRVAEYKSIYFLNGTVTFTHGSVPSLQRAVYIVAPTYANSSGSDTLATAATLDISGAPIASGLTITNSYAILVESGNVSLASGQLNQSAATQIWNGNTVKFDTAMEFDATGVASGKYLKYDGTKWVPDSPGNVYIGVGPAFPNIAIWANATTVAGSTQFMFDNLTLTVSPLAAVLVNPVKTLYVKTAGHTLVSYSTEEIHIDFDMGLLQSGASGPGGTLAALRGFVVRAPIYGLTSIATTISDVATMAITDAPSISGGVLTATRLHAFWVQSGEVALAGGLDVGTATGAGTGDIKGSGALTMTGGLGVNGTSAQTAYASGGALATYGAGANGFDTAGHASALYAMVVAIRAALVADGVMS